MYTKINNIKFGYIIEGERKKLYIKEKSMYIKLGAERLMLLKFLLRVV